MTGEMDKFLETYSEFGECLGTGVKNVSCFNIKGKLKELLKKKKTC